MICTKSRYSLVLHLLPLSLALLIVLAGSAADAQRGGPATSSPEQRTAAAAADLESVTGNLLSHFVAQNKAPTPVDIEELRVSLRAVERYLARFDKSHKAYYYLLEAFAAHYSGDANGALIKAQKAFQTNSLDVDVCDSVVTLALCYRKYDLARTVLNERNAGAAVRTRLELPQVSFDDSWAQISRKMEPEDTKDPNQRTAERQVDPNFITSKSGAAVAAPREESGLGFLAQNNRRPPSSGMFKIDVAEEPSESATSSATEQKSTPKRSRPRPAHRPRPTRRPGPGMPKGILNLPVEAMIPDNLGASLSALDLRSINGSYYHFGPGTGQMLCMFSWSLPEEGSASYPTARMSHPGPRGSRGPTESKISPPAIDFHTNLTQFRELFGPYFLTGKIGFVAVNLDGVNKIGELVELLCTDAWPWVNCMFADNLNAEQLLPYVQAQPVITIVGVDGQICYVGPVGGYLPLMIFDTELAQATFAMPTPSERQSGPAVTGTSTSTQAAEPPPSRETSDTQPPKTVSQAKTSDPRAKQILGVARVKRRLSPHGALQEYDRILENFPDSLEAEKAKLFIKTIIRSEPQIARDREIQQKYPYDK